MTLQENSEFLDSVVVEPRQTPATHSVIWLHGLGANGHDFVPIASTMEKFQSSCACRFVFPHAPEMEVTINNDALMPAWFDVISLDWDADWDEKGMWRSRKNINELIEKEVASGVPHENIFLIGFSQGGAVALLTGITYPRKLAGLVGLSTFLPLSEEAKTHIEAANQQTPILMMHGKEDNVVNVNHGERSVTLLQETHDHVFWRAYDYLGHHVTPEEMDELDTWLAQIVAG